VKYSQTGNWAKLASTARDIAAGDMNGDSQKELLATWDGLGVYYRINGTGAWVKMATPSTQVTGGDLDGDGTDDVIGIWPGQGGVWVKLSRTGSWSRLASTAVDIAAGKMRAGGSKLNLEEQATALLAMGDHEWGPIECAGMLDLSADAPGGMHFVCSEADNLEPHEPGRNQAQIVPGPGEPGFVCTEQANLEPRKNDKPRENSIKFTSKKKGELKAEARIR
jgi:hypothetical protein